MWLQSFEQDVGKWFENRVTDEEDCQTDIVLGVRHIQIRHQLGINMN
jgi:hypothetical protein